VYHDFMSMLPTQQYLYAADRHNQACICPAGLEQCWGQ